MNNKQLSILRKKFNEDKTLQEEYGHISVSLNDNHNFLNVETEKCGKLLEVALDNQELLPKEGNEIDLRVVGTILTVVFPD